MSDQKTEQKPDHEKRIREALEAGPTEGPFEVVRCGSYCNDIKTTDGYIVATTHGYVGDQVDSRPTADFIAACNPTAIRALLADLDAMRGALKSVQAAIYMDDAGQLRLTRSFDESTIDAALKGASA